MKKLKHKPMTLAKAIRVEQNTLQGLIAEERKKKKLALLKRRAEKNPEGLDGYRYSQVRAK